MFHEMRIYEAEPARLPVLVKRFTETNMNLFDKYGFSPIGYWIEEVGTPHRIIYILSWNTWEQRAASWQSFYQDPLWLESIEKNGPTVQRIQSSILTPIKFK